MTIYKGSPTKDGRVYFFRTFKNGKDYMSKKYLTKEEARKEEALFKLKKEVIRRKKFGLVAYDFFSQLKERRKLSTYQTLLGDYNNHIKPYFEHSYVDSINISKLREWLDIVAKKGYSYNYSNKLYTIMSMILDFAVTNYGLENNELKKLPRFERTQKVVKDTEKIRYLTAEQFDLFLSKVPDGIYKKLFQFGFLTGCRKGEMLALKFSDIDLNNKLIFINKTLYPKIKGMTGDNVYISNTKTGENRTIQMSDKLYNMLLDHKNESMKSPEYSDEWYLFGGYDYLKPSSIDRFKNKALDEANLPHLSMHELCRHSHVSNLISLYLMSGQNDTTKFFLLCSKRLGHSIQVMEKTYLHLFPQTQNEIVDLLNKM